MNFYAGFVANRSKDRRLECISVDILFAYHARVTNAKFVMINKAGFRLKMGIVHSQHIIRQKLRLILIPSFADIHILSFNI